MSELAVSPVTVLEAAMSSTGQVEWAGALWIGAVDDVELASGRQLLPLIAGYRTARLLVRSGRYPRGFVEAGIVDGRIDVAALSTAIDQLPPPAPGRPALRPPVSVVLCTYDRPLQLAAAVRSLLALDYPAFEIVVVDNHPQSGRTAAAVAGFDDPRVRLVDEPRAGLARARNTGALAANYATIAFTDDDVVIDSQWLLGVADGFAAGTDVACVCGIVPSGEIRSPSQAYFDRRVSWARNCTAELFSLAAPPADEPLFPFQVGRFGTGANFAVRRSSLVALGGFDEGLGVGSPCGGGEDIDLFTRVLLAGHQLAYAPSALVWHRHRSDLASLTVQVANYGTGLGAWLGKLALRPRTLAMMLRRAAPGILHLSRVTRLPTPVIGLPPEHDDLWRIERRAVLLGPFALLRARLAGDRPRPLTAVRVPKPVPVPVPVPVPMSMSVPGSQVNSADPPSTAVFCDPATPQEQP
jgi:GT2 family glycosyltransferase